MTAMLRPRCPQSECAALARLRAAVPTEAQAAGWVPAIAPEPPKMLAVALNRPVGSVHYERTAQVHHDGKVVMAFAPIDVLSMKPDTLHSWLRVSGIPV